jgi:hypothetical protein
MVLPDAQYKIDSIPFFVIGVSLGDVITVRRRKGEYLYSELVSESGHSTVRVVFFDHAHLSSLRSKLRHLGCPSELASEAGLIAIDIPPEVSYAPILSLLAEGERQGYWDYEEATVSEIHKDA